MKASNPFSPLAMAVLMSLVSAGFVSAQDGEAVVFDESQPFADTMDDAFGEPDLDEEAGRIEATIDEIDALIALPEGARLREADEDPLNPQDAFQQRGVENLLGTAPRFVYVPQGVSPMIIPWVREQVVLEELQLEVNALRASGDPANLQKALETVRRVTEQYGTNPNAAWARETEVALLASLRGPEDQQQTEQPIQVVTGPTAEEITLPAWIPENTLGVMYDRANPGNSMVLIGRDLLNPGQRVPRYSQVVVKEVGQSEVDGRVEDGYVVYEFRNREFRVPVRETR